MLKLSWYGSTAPLAVKAWAAAIVLALSMLTLLGLAQRRWARLTPGG